MGASKLRFAALFLAAAAIAFGVGRSLARRGEVTVSPVVAVQPHLPPPPPPSAPAAAPAAKPPPGRAEQDRQERLREIDAELDSLPADDAARLEGLAGEMRSERERITELRNGIAASQRGLLEEAARASTGGGGGERLAFAEQLSALDQELVDAKIAVAEQERLLAQTFGNTGAEFIVGMRAELARRKARESAVQKRIADLYGSAAAAGARKDGQARARLDAWRARESLLASEYARALEQLSQTSRAYRELALEAAEHRKEAEALEAERKTLEGARPE